MILGLILFENYYIDDFICRKLSNLEVRLPLPSNNPLIVATDAVITQKPSCKSLNHFFYHV